MDASSAQEAPRDIPPETVETDFSVVSEVVTDSSVATSCGPVLAIKSKEIVSSDADSLTASDGEEVVTYSDDAHDQEGTCVIPELHKGSDDQIKGPDEEVGLLSVGSNEGQSPVEASLPSSQELEAEGSPHKERQEDVNEDHKIEPSGKSDWETGSPRFFVHLSTLFNLILIFVNIRCTSSKLRIRFSPVQKCGICVGEEEE